MAKNVVIFVIYECKHMLTNSAVEDRLWNLLTVVPSLLIIFQGCANKMLSEDEFWYATPLVLLIGEQLVSTPFNLPFSLSKQSYMEKIPKSLQQRFLTSLQFISVDPRSW